MLGDGRVKEAAALVAHLPMSPAFGFRIETDAGSIVFSGETGCA